MLRRDGLRLARPPGGCSRERRT